MKKDQENHITLLETLNRFTMKSNLTIVIMLIIKLVFEQSYRICSYIFSYILNNANSIILGIQRAISEASTGIRTVTIHKSYSFIDVIKSIGNFSRFLHQCEILSASNLFKTHSAYWAHACIYHCTRQAHPLLSFMHIDLFSYDMGDMGPCSFFQ